ncbi:MAG: hypothetical protein J6V47_05595 [Bacteroidaceae bacterium]|nr:hypothetical protein [Bacteroidaceae bacterium]
MAYIDNTRPHSHCAYELTLCITKDEAEALMPLFRRALKDARKCYDKYKDIHESGEATTAQQNKLMEYEYKVEALKSVVMTAETLRR